MSTINENGLLDSAKHWFARGRQAERAESIPPMSNRPKSSDGPRMSDSLSALDPSSSRPRRSSDVSPSRVFNPRGATSAQPPIPRTLQPGQGPKPVIKSDMNLKIDAGFNPSPKSNPNANLDVNIGNKPNPTSSTLSPTQNGPLLRVNPPATRDLATLPSVRITINPYKTREDSFTFKPFTFELHASGPSVPFCRDINIPPKSGTFVNGRVEFNSRVVTRGSHAHMWYQNRKIYIQDTGSSGGTWLGDDLLAIEGVTKVSRPYEVKDGDVIRLGKDYANGPPGDMTYKCVMLRISIQYPPMDISFNCEQHCNCRWRAVLDKKRIYPLEFPVRNAGNVLAAFHAWSHRPDLADQWDTWTEDEGEVVLFVLERLTASLKSSPMEQKHCQSWTRKIARQTGALPPSFVLRGVERTQELPVSGGGFADIYMGSYLGEPVALKVLRIFNTANGRKKLHKELAQEALYWKHLDHPYILPFFGIAHDVLPLRLSFVSPWMPNGNILQYLENRPGADKLALLSQCAHGLRYLHGSEMGLVHGDIKSVNILIDADGNARISDFGLIGISDSQGWNTTATSQGDKGTVRYMAPELFQVQVKKSRASDVYAFGITIVEIYTGTPPFTSGYTDVQVMMAVCNGDRPQRPGPEIGISDELWLLATECWQAEPRLRPSMQQVAESLDFQIAQRVDMDVPTIEVMGVNNEPYPLNSAVTLSRISLDTQVSEGSGRYNDSYRR